MSWHASLKLDYRLEPRGEAMRTVARFEHDGPLRILQSLWPEGDAICHNILVHPPGGLVGGDTLDIAVTAQPDSHGLITTPGAGRFYRSDAEPAVQRTSLRLGSGARLEWLPLESICFPGCIAQNRLHADLAPGAELIGWDIAALGLPLAKQRFDRGQLMQHIELEGAWLERALIDARDSRLMDGPLGLAGHRCVASLFLMTGSPIPRDRRDRALELARGAIDEAPADVFAGATACDSRVIVIRALGPVAESVGHLLRSVRRRWRADLWNLPGPEPRGWTI